MFRLVSTATIAGILLAAFPAAAQEGTGGSIDVEEIAGNRTGTSFTYIAKFLCGTIPVEGVATAVERQLPAASGTFSLVPGTYLSGINVLNPTRQTVRITKFVVPAPPERIAVDPPDDVAPGLGPSPEVNESLDSLHAFEVDCRDIVEGGNGQDPLLDLGGLPPIMLDDDFVPGFLVIRSNRRLKVVAVYTFNRSEPE